MAFLISVLPIAKYTRELVSGSIINLEPPKSTAGVLKHQPLISVNYNTRLTTIKIPEIKNE